MPSKNRITVNPTPEFMAFLKTYAEQRGFKSNAEALLNLVEDGAEAEGFEGIVMKGRGKYARKNG